MEVGLGPDHIVLDWNPVPLPKRDTAAQFSAHFHCGQTALCIKMLLGMEVGFGPDRIMLDGDPASPSPKRGQSLPNFRSMPIVAKRLYGS